MTYPREKEMIEIKAEITKSVNKLHSLINEGWDISPIETTRAIREAVCVDDLSDAMDIRNAFLGVHYG